MNAPEGYARWHMKQDEMLCSVLLFALLKFYVLLCFPGIHPDSYATENALLNNSYVFWINVVSSVSICSLRTDSNILSTGLDQLQNCLMWKYNVRARYLDCGSPIMKYIATTKNRACTDSRCRNDIAHYFNTFKIYRANGACH